MKRKGKILATILAISMLASIASTTAFAASPMPTSSVLGEAAQDRIVSSMEQVDIATVGETQYLVVGVESASVEKPALFFLCDDETVAELSDTFVASVSDLQYVPGYNDLSDAEKLELQTQSIGNYVVTVTGLKQGTTVINVLTEGDLTLDIPVNVAQVQEPHLNVTEVSLNTEERFTIEILGYTGDPNNLMWLPVDEEGFMWTEGLPPIGFDLPEGTDMPSGESVTIYGVGAGTISLSCLDMTKADMGALQNAKTPEEMATILKPAVIATCHVTGLAMTQGVKLEGFQNTDTEFTITGIGLSDTGFAQNLPRGASDEQPLIFESDDETIATISAIQMNTIEQYIRAIFNGELAEELIKNVTPEQIAEFNAQYKGMYTVSVTGTGIGSTTVRVKTQDGKFHDEMPVTVVNGLGKLEMNRKNVTIPVDTDTYIDGFYGPEGFNPDDPELGNKNMDVRVTDVDGNYVDNRPSGFDRKIYASFYTENGKPRLSIKAYQPGTYHLKLSITSQIWAAPTITEDLTITVVEEEVPAERAQFNQEKINLNIGDLQKLNLSEILDNMDVHHWKSSDPSVATVDQQGNVTAVKLGVTTITAQVGDRTIPAKCTVVVKDWEEGELLPYLFADFDEINHTVSLVGIYPGFSFKNPTLPSEVRISEKKKYTEKSLSQKPSQSDVYKSIDDGTGEVYTVTKIVDKAFSGGSDFFNGTVNGLYGTLTIPGSIKEIGKEAFSECYNIDKVILEDGIEAIGERAFAFCRSLNGSITIPQSVTQIGGNAFYINIDYPKYPYLGKNFDEIIIHKPENSLAGAPWGAYGANVIWLD